MRGFRSLKEYHDALLVQTIVSLLFGGVTIVYNAWLGVVLLGYSSFCLYLAINHDPTLDYTEKR